MYGAFVSLCVPRTARKVSLMQVDELVSLHKWIDENVAGLQLQQRFAALHAKLQHNTRGQQQQPLEQERNNVQAALEAMSFDTLTDGQQEMLDRLGLSEHVGAAGAKRLEDVLFRQSLDVATAATRVQESVNAVAAAVQKSQELKSALNVIVVDAPPDAEAPVVVRLTFKQDASIANVVDLKEWSAVWHRVAHGFAMAHGGSAEAVRVVGASNGSLVLVLGTTTMIASALAHVLLRGLKVAQRVLDLRMTAEELRGKKLQNDKIAADLEVEATNARLNGMEEIVQELVHRVGVKDGEGDKASALRRAVEDVLGFLEKGGEIDPVLPAASEQASDDDDSTGEVGQIEELRRVLAEVRQTRDELRLLEDDRTK